MLIKNAVLYGIECKRPESKQSDAQMEFQESFEVVGGRYILACPLDDV